MRVVLSLLAGALAVLAQTPDPAKPPVEPVKKASLAGQVVSTTGEPVRRADVTVRRTDARDISVASAAIKAVTDANGAFSFPELEPGRYMLMVEKPGFVRQYYGARTPGRGGTNLQLAPGQAMRDIGLRITPHGVIAGKVTDEEGEPIARAMVQAMQQRYFRNRRQWTPVGGGQVNDLGEYRIAGLAPGRYVLAVNPGPPMGMMQAAAAGPDADMGYVTTYHPGTTDPAQAAPVDVTVGAEVRGIDLRMPKVKTFRISGKVIDAATNQPPRNASVMVFSNDAGSMMMNRSFSAVRPDGSFTLTGLTAGSYMVVANRMGPDRTGARTEVTVSGENVEGVTLTIGAGLSIPGAIKVEGKGKFDMRSLRVFFEPASGGPMFAGPGMGEVKEDGTFKADNISPDKYRVRVYPLQDAYIKAVRAGNQTSADSTIDLTSTAPVEIVINTDAAVVDGVIHDSKKRPAPGVVVVLAPETTLRSRSELFRQATTDANGAFQLKALPPGDYKLFAWEEVEEGAWLDPAFLSQHEASGKGVSLKEGSQQTVTMGFIAPESGSQIERETDEKEKAAKQ